MSGPQEILSACCEKTDRGSLMMTKTKKLTYTAIGIALFAALSLCLQVPVFENYYLCLGYAVMTVYCYLFGPWAGAAVGSLGVVVYCLLTSGLRGMPGWALGNILIGIVMGLVFKKIRGKEIRPWMWILTGIAAVAATAAAMLGIKSVTESLLYSQPLIVRIGKNIYAFAADAAMIVLSLPLCLSVYLRSRKVPPVHS